MLKKLISRRAFLLSSAVGASFPLFVPQHVLGRGSWVSPNERLETALVGLGNRGRDLLEEALKAPDMQVSFVCDCFQPHLEAACDRVNAFYGTRDCRKSARYEDILQEAGVDVIINATPDHWHTKISVEACQARKDVYCETPLTLTPLESRQLVSAARTYNRMVTGGSQAVMEEYGYMAPIVQGGALGEVSAAYVQVGNPPRDRLVPQETLPLPEGLDWDRWLGQAPWMPYHPCRFSGRSDGGWREFPEYGNGFLGDWGSHKFAAVLYILGLETEEPVRLLPPHSEGNEASGTLAIYRNGFKLYHARDGHDITLKGTARTFRHRQDRVEAMPLDHATVRRYHANATRLMADFSWSVLHRARPFQDVEYSAHAATLCQLMVLCYRLNRRLDWDAASCSFVDDPSATRMLQRLQRDPYQINF